MDLRAVAFLWVRLSSLMDIGPKAAYLTGFRCVVTSAFLVLIVTSIFTVVCYRHFECGFAHYRRTPHLSCCSASTKYRPTVRADRELARTGFEPEVFARATEDPEKAAEAGTEPPSRFSWGSDLQADAKPLKVGWSLP
jgi:hypothetical protein